MADGPADGRPPAGTPVRVPLPDGNIEALQHLRALLAGWKAGMTSS
jgi:hypothetical protein